MPANLIPTPLPADSNHYWDKHAACLLLPCCLLRCNENANLAFDSQDRLKCERAALHVLLRRYHHYGTILYSHHHPTQANSAYRPLLETFAPAATTNFEHYSPTLIHLGCHTTDSLTNRKFLSGTISPPRATRQPRVPPACSVTDAQHKTLSSPHRVIGSSLHNGVDFQCQPVSTHHSVHRDNRIDKPATFPIP